MKTVLPLKHLETICSNPENAEKLLELFMHLQYPELYQDKDKE